MASDDRGCDRAAIWPCEGSGGRTGITERYEKAADFYPQYIRGLAFAKLNKPQESAREFDKILEHRGEAPLSALYPLAQLGKARATRSKADYEKFFDLWSEADKDMPALVAAKAEYDIL